MDLTSPSDRNTRLRVRTAQRQAALFVALTWAQTLALALALPHAGIAPLIAIATPLISVGLIVGLATPAGSRRAVWAGVGFGPPRWWGLLIALAVPAAITAASFAAAVAADVARFPAVDIGDLVSTRALNLIVTIAIFAVVFLGEEIGWRGYLLPRLSEIMSGRLASFVTGACHAIFHLPLLVLTTTYQSAGNRLIVVPLVMVTLTLAGVVYGWLRAVTASIWPVSLAHSAFNNFMETAGAAAVATSPAALAYVTTETGVFTVIFMIVLSGWLLTKRAADFHRLRPVTAEHGKPLMIVSRFVDMSRWMTDAAGAGLCLADPRQTGSSMSHGSDESRSWSRRTAMSSSTLASSRLMI